MEPSTNDSRGSQQPSRPIKAIQEIVELNQDQTYTFGRDTLIMMLDQALEASNTSVQ
jgi:hypothetical protein